MNYEISKINIFLSGGGDEKDSFLLDEDFISSLPKNGKILYIPFASERSFLGYEPSYEWVVKSLSQHSENFIDIEMWTDFNGHSPDELGEYCAVYIGGGNTFRLLQKIYQYGFADPLKKFIKEGGLMYGGSAGAIVMGKNIDTVSEENRNMYLNSEGLSMIGEYSVICHYKESLDEKISYYVERNYIPVIALSERSGLKIVDNYAIALGYYPIVIFNGRNDRRKLESGSKLAYKNV